MDRWTICEKDHVHWGADGAAGLLFKHMPQKGEPSYLLQQRSRWVDYAGTWGIPGGAIRTGESPELTARREAEEEIGPLGSYRVTGMDIQDCGGGWKFHTITADVDSPFRAFCVQETDATGWFTREEMCCLSLHLDFANGWMSIDTQHPIWPSHGHQGGIGPGKPSIKLLPVETDCGRTRGMGQLKLNFPWR